MYIYIPFDNQTWQLKICQFLVVLWEIPRTIARVFSSKPRLIIRRYMSVLCALHVSYTSFIWFSCGCSMPLHSIYMGFLPKRFSRGFLYSLYGVDIPRFFSASPSFRAAKAAWEPSTATTSCNHDRGPQEIACCRKVAEWTMAYGCLW